VRIGHFRGLGLLLRLDLDSNIVSNAFVSRGLFNVIPPNVPASPPGVLGVRNRRQSLRITVIALSGGDRSRLMFRFWENRQEARALAIVESQLEVAIPHSR
jgi:hypothetical protein